MNIENFFDEMIQNRKAPFFKKKTNNALLEVFERYYQTKRDETVSYMPLLIYCLAYKKYLRIIDCINKDDYVLFDVTLPQKNDQETNTEKSNNRKRYVVCQIPQEELDEWIDVINYYKKDFQEQVSKQNERTLLYDLLIKGQESPISSEIQLLFNYTQDVIGIMEKEDHLPHFVTALNEHLSRINLWTHDQMKKEKMLRFADHFLHPCMYSSIFNPFSGSCLETLFLDQTHRFVGYTHLNKSYYLGKLIMLTQDQWFSNEVNLFPNFAEHKETFDHAIVDLELDLDATPFYDVRNEEINAKVLTTTLENLNDRGDLFCAISAPIDGQHCYRNIIQKLIKNKWLKKIISFRDHTVMLYINKYSELSSTHRGVEYIQVNEFFNYYGFDDWQEGRCVDLLKLSEQDIVAEDYSLTYNLVAKRIAQKEEQEDFTFLRLGCFLKDEEKHKKSDDNDNTQLLLEDIFSTDLPNYPLKPFVSTLDGGPIDEKGKYASLIQKTSLIFNPELLSPFEPRIYDDSWGDALTDANFLTIDTNIVDPEYLVLEISKSYFQEQLKQSREMQKNWKKDFNQLLQSLYIKVPKCRTSLERQKQLVDTARWKHMNETMTAVMGQDFSVLAKAEDTFLKRETTLLQGKYSIEDYLGKGGFGHTYRALNNNPRPGEPWQVAIKEFFVSDYQVRNPESDNVMPRLGKDMSLIEKARKKFHHEATKIQKLASCPYVIDVYDVFDENNTTYYVMEYLENGDLRRYTQLMGKGNELEEATATRIIHEVAEALRAMHRMQMNHLDVKPSNILIDNDGHARLIDFGTVKDFGEGNQTTTVNIASQGFSAPEVRYGLLKTFSPQADIYSLGKTLEYMLQEKTAPQETSGFITEVPASNLSPAMEELIEKCTAYDPEDRPKNIDEFLMLLDQCNS